MFSVVSQISTFGLDRVADIYVLVFCNYPHMPIDMLEIYRLLFLFLRRILVTDISDVGWLRVTKFCRMLDLRVYQSLLPFW